MQQRYVTDQSLWWEAADGSKVSFPKKSLVKESEAELHHTHLELIWIYFYYYKSICVLHRPKDSVVSI